MSASLFRVLPLLSLTVFATPLAWAVPKTPIYSSDGDLIIAVVLNTCQNSTHQQTPFLRQTLVSSAAWVVQRLNLLEYAAPLKFGVSIWDICGEKDYYNTFFKLFQTQDGEDFLIGTISDVSLKPKLRRFCDVLDIRTRSVVKFLQPLIETTVKLLNFLNLKDNIVVGAPSEVIVYDFFKLSRLQWMCIKEYFVYENNFEYSPVNGTETLVVFGDHSRLTHFVHDFQESAREHLNLVLVPTDGSVINDLPRRAYIVLPPHTAPASGQKTSTDFTPTPLLFDIANPILSYAHNIKCIADEHCNGTLNKISCLRRKMSGGIGDTFFEIPQIIDQLKIDPLRSAFGYNVFKAVNASQNYQKVLHYSTFDQNFTVFDPSILDAVDNDSDTSDVPKCKSTENCQTQCRNFIDFDTLDNYIVDGGHIRIRTEPWVYAFLSLALLGVMFCVAILIFLIICICRRDILEGNPVLTLLLLIGVMSMYCSVIPFGLEGTKPHDDSLCLARSLSTSLNNESICLARSLSSTLSFAFVFSLILSRCILLATASKEIGFMSHIAGPVQSFLCLFIFGVQAALSLQLLGHCNDIFDNNSFLYLLSYNAMLLMLLVCLCPLITRCQRNYREGKYFTISVLLIACSWCAWMTCYGVLGEDWKDPILCFGLVSTASVIIGAVFIPRTYMMTLAAAREKITSTLPSLPTATSTLDLYRASSQPVYDCINVAAINAVTVARAGVNVSQQPDLYSCPNLPDDEDFEERCGTPINSDKVTRF